MNTVFYLFALIYLIYEIDYIMHISQRISKGEDTEDVIAKYKHLGWKRSPKEYKDAIYDGIVGIAIIVYDFTGLLTDQWFSFLCFIAYDLIILTAVKKISKNETYYFWVVFCNTIIQIMFTLLIILNHYHFHIDTLAWFISLFQ